MTEVLETVEWMCGVCRYVYVAESGDPKANIAPGTQLEDLPEDWVYPVCKAKKDKFFDV